jgi:hypothetical protein
VITEVVRLYGYTDSFKEAERTIRALLFGEMVKRAALTLEQYQSDLYHDATWVTENVNGPTEFDFLVRPSGTHIGLYASAPGYAADMARQERAVLYKFVLEEENGSWFARVTTYAASDFPLKGLPEEAV